MVSVAFVCAFLLTLTASAADDETTCLRPRSTSTLTEAELLTEHIVGVLTSKCTALKNCNSHGYCQPVSQTCFCHDQWGGVDDIYDYVAPDCSTRKQA